uniref:Major sperm protein n=1 Tax=Panagrellus redivivus TaxID=6233 RepID=A0A7E4W7F9_PANRE
MAAVAETPNNEDNASGQSSTPQLKLVNLDQKFICFDVEQLGDAKQRLQVIRQEGNKRVAWRVRTNAPTRYVVCPNGGVLDDTNPTQTFVVELVGNRYNPHHKLVLQSIQLLDSESPKVIWKSDRAKNHEYVQTIDLELSTTLMNLESTQQMSIDGAGKASASLTSLLEQSSTTGLERVKELEALHEMLKSDTKKLNANLDKTVKLKDILETHLQNRKQTISELTTKLEDGETKLVSLTLKIKNQEGALQEMQARNKMNEQQCAVM